MDSSTMVVWIVAISIVGATAITWMTAGRRRSSRYFVKRRDFDEVVKRLEAAEARIGVLEKLATDADRGLAAEIDQLANSDAAKQAPA